MYHILIYLFHILNNMVVYEMFSNSFVYPPIKFIISIMKILLLYFKTNKRKCYIIVEKWKKFVSKSKGFNYDRRILI